MTDEQLQSLFAGMERRLEKRADETDKRLERFSERLSEIETALRAEIKEGRAATEHVETALLTEFHKWASPVDSKLRTHRSWFYEVDLEVEALKERVRKLEDKQKPPTQ